ASILTPEQVEEIRSFKNKVSAYMIVKDYHINKNCISDIWDNSKHLQ
ncbi:1598_t:CDS:1, partial [Funneliformis geosporum]